MSEFHKYKFIVGIDPGKNTGWSVLDIENQKIIKTGTFKERAFFEAFNFINAEYHPANTLLVIENPNLNSATWNPRFPKNRMELAIRDKQSQHVGGNKMFAQLLIDELRFIGFQIEEYRPAKGEPKWDKDFFEKQTGITTRTSEHSRDSVRAIWKFKDKYRLVCTCQTTGNCLCSCDVCSFNNAMDKII